MAESGQLVDTYKVISDGISADVKIIRTPAEFVLIYNIALPNIDAATAAILREIRMELIREVPDKIQQLSENLNQSLKLQFLDIVTSKLKQLLPNMEDVAYINLSATLLHEMFGLGELEVLDADVNLEEIVVNNSKTNVFVYHRKHGWLLTNLRVESENKIAAYSEQIARRVGRQINNLAPLLDAQLPSGDRVNATLYPISMHGNTLDLRKFRAEPWTVVDMMNLGTLSIDLVAYLWQAMQYELSIIMTGGTASGKTSLLNVMLPFIPPNQRIITIEDTSELVLPNFLHWVPMITRQPNSEGKGKVDMLDLLLNSLRMRPDRLVVGEIRHKEEAETLFEALMTGHSVYATLHAETAQQVIKRLLSEPINLPEIEVSAMDLIVTAFRQRRLGIRRVLELAEVADTMVAGKAEVKTVNLFEWRPRTDKLERTINASIKLRNKLELYSGMTSEEIDQDLIEKAKVLKWMTENNVSNVNRIGYIASLYYSYKDELMNVVNKNGSTAELNLPQ